MSGGRLLFDEIVSLTGVAPMFASGMVTRALADGGVSIDDAVASHYEEALPRLRARLKAYLPPDQAEDRAQAILLRLTRLQGAPARPTPSGLLRYRVKAQIAERARDADAEAAPPRSGERSVPAQVAARPASPRPLAAVDVSQLDSDDDEDFTLVGRRWTADELAALRAASVATKK